MIALEARALQKSFGKAEVLRGASLTLRAGEVHALAGGNGAGKSTIIKILAGVHADFEGELLLGGAPRRFADPLAARRAGVATIHQELSLVGAMSVADNLLLGREPRGRFGLVDRGALRLEARRVLDAFGLELDPGTPVEALPIAAQQLLEIAKALGGDARVLIFDEPTSALDDAEADRLLARIDALRREGRAILFVSHRMEEIYRIADRITVLRDGVCVTTAAPAELPREELIRRMLGGETRGREKEQGGGEDGEGETRGRDKEQEGRENSPSIFSLAPPRPPRLPVLSLSSLSVPSLEVEGRLDVEDASFSVASGEIVGVAGLRGAGAGALLEALYGARPAAGGRIEIDGRPASIGAPADALRQGVALLAGDRQRAGVVPALDLVQNATLASLARWSAGPWILRERERAAVAELCAEVGLRDAALDAEVGSLSGGTQQKVCLARCLLASPRVLLLDEPTRGVDVGAKADIHDLIRRLARRGAAVLFASSELTELCALADRVLVLHRGRLVADLPRADATRERILHEAMGGGRS